MAFINALGKSISFECTEMIAELKQDIIEFGGDKILYVVTEDMEGVTIYKDYNFKNDFVLNPKEKVEQITATSLLMLYEKENSII